MAPYATECREFPAAGAAECAECAAQLAERLACNQQHKMGAAAEAEQLPHLLDIVPLNLQEGGDYALVPNSWLAIWRRYVAEGTKPKAATAAASPPPPPGPLPEALRSLLCRCGMHGCSSTAAAISLTSRRVRNQLVCGWLHTYACTVRTWHSSLSPML